MELMKGCNRTIFHLFSPLFHLETAQLRYYVGGTKYGEVGGLFAPKLDLTITGSSSKSLDFAVKWLFWLKIFFACGALKGATPESATLAVTIIPVTPDHHSKPRAVAVHRTAGAAPQNHRF